MKLSFKPVTVAAVLLTGGFFWTSFADAADAVRRSRSGRISGAGYVRSDRRQVERNNDPNSSIVLPYVAGVGTGLWVDSWYRNRWWRDGSVSSDFWENSQTTTSWNQPAAVQNDVCSPQLYLDTLTGVQVWGTTCSTTEELRAKVQSQSPVFPSASVQVASSQQTYSQSSPIRYSPSPQSRGLGVFFDWLSGDS